MASLDDYRRALLGGDEQQQQPKSTSMLDAYRHALLGEEEPAQTKAASAADEKNQPVQQPRKLREILPISQDWSNLPIPVEAAEGAWQGLKDTGLSVRRIIRGGNEAVPALKAIDKALTGYDEKTLAKAIEDRIAATKEYDKSDAAKSIPAQVGRFVGQTAVSLPFTLGAGLGLRGAAGAVGPTAGKFANWLTGSGGTVSNALAGAETGAAAQALNYGASEQPFGEHVKEGMVAGGALGGAARFIPQTASNLYNYGRTIGNTLTEGGQNRIADQILTRYAGDNVRLNPSSAIPSVERTLPEAIEGGSPGVSGLYRTLENSPETNSLLVQRAQDNSANRLAYFENLAKSPDELKQLRADRLANEAPAISNVFAPGQYSDTLPVVQQIDQALLGESGKRPGIRSALEDVRKLLIGKPQNGIQTLESDPALLYNSVRKHVGDILERRLGPNSPPVDSDMARHLLGIKSALDDAIESGAPGFKQAIKDYADASKPISQMEFLQGLNITDAKGNLTLQKVKTAFEKAQKGRSVPGANNAKALDNDQMDALSTLYEDMLKAEQLNLGKARGSNTTQNLLSEEVLNALSGGSSNPLTKLAVNPMVSGAAVGAAAGHLLGPGVGMYAGPAIGSAAGNMMQRALNSKNETIRRMILDRMLEPNLYTPRLPARALPTNDLLPGVSGGAASPLISQ